MFRIIQFLCFLIPGLLCAAAAHLVCRKRPASPVHFLGLSVLGGVLTFGSAMMVLIPLDRMRFYMNSRQPHYVFGAAGYLYLAAVSVLLGVLFGLIGRKAAVRCSVVPKEKRRLTLGRRIGTLLCRGLLWLFLLATVAFCWELNFYYDVSLEEIAFHLGVPLKGTSNDFWLSLVTQVLLPAAALIALCEALIHLPIRKEYRFDSRFGWLRGSVLPLRPGLRLSALLLVFLFAVLLSRVWPSMKVGEFLSARIVRSTFIEDHYTDPRAVNVTFPEHKRNLVYILMESGESTPQDVENGGLMTVNYIPEMTALAKENVSFSQGDAIQGASVAPGCGWTIAGMVAESCGLPLKLFANVARQGETDGFMAKAESFLPGATSIYELMKENGYGTYFQCGSNIVFAGRKTFLTQHGVDEEDIYDFKYSFQAGEVTEKATYWGYKDIRLYEFAKKHLTEIAAKDEPFCYVMLTVDTHAPDGYRCELCKDDTGNKYQSVISCASRQVSAFVEWIQAQDFYEDTTIIICGDHASMASDYDHSFYAVDIDKHGASTERKVYNAVINPAKTPAKEKNRVFTTLDMAPTTLSALGVEIEGDRLGLGTDLFSETPTLCEEVGSDVFMTEVAKTSLFYNEKLLYVQSR